MTARALCATAPAGRRACASVELALAEGRAPEWITLLTPGPLHARDGRRWRLDDPDAVVAATRERAGATDMVIDYEHQSEWAPTNGQPAPAAGWIREVGVGGDGAIRARVEWTARARAAIEAREYRYLSPVFTYAPDGRVGVVINATLTNSPALDLPALARDTGATHMPDHLRRLLQRLGIDPDAVDEAGVAAAIARLDGGLAAADRTALATALGAAADAAPGDLVARARSLATQTPDPAQYVPRADFDSLATRVAALATERLDEQVASAVDTAIAEGRLMPAQREWATAYARSDLEGFRGYIAAAPVILAPGARTAPAPAPADAALTAEERALCRAMGLTEKAFRDARAARAGGEA